MMISGTFLLILSSLRMLVYLCARVAYVPGSFPRTGSYVGPNYIVGPYSTNLFS
jgi:hypothetical protein